MASDEIKRKGDADRVPASAPSRQSPEPTRRPVLSVVVPCFNEARNIEALAGRLLPALVATGETFEILFVNDGSADDTLERLLALRRRHPQIVVIDLSRNFGKEAALSAGLAAARGDAAIPIDADLQHPPELIATFLKKWREGYEVVYAVREARTGQGALHGLSARAFYWLFDRMSEVPLPREAGDFRLLDRRVVDALNRMPERTRFMKGLFAWVGFRQIGVPYVQGERTHGGSTFSFFSLLRFALGGLTAFSTFPLRVWGVVGAAISSLAFFYIVVRLVRTLLYGIDVPGYESLIMTVLLLGGMQLLTLGIIGDYLGRVFNEVKGRPIYIVRATYDDESRAESRDEDDDVAAQSFASKHPDPTTNRR